MKKILIFILCLFSINLFANIEVNKALKEIENLEKELILKYKEKNIVIDLSKDNPNEIRMFNETLYLKFLSKYVKGIVDVKIYSTNKVSNILIFSDIPIEKKDFDDIFIIFEKINLNKRINLIQVPTEENRVKVYEVIQEKKSERK